MKFFKQQQQIESFQTRVQGLEKSLFFQGPCDRKLDDLFYFSMAFFFTKKIVFTTRNNSNGMTE